LGMCQILIPLVLPPGNPQVSSSHTATGRIRRWLAMGADPGGMANRPSMNMVMLGGPDRFRCGACDRRSDEESHIHFHE